MKLEYRIATASGAHRKDCHYLTWRYQADLGPQLEEMDSWVVRADGSEHRVELSVPGWISGLWRSPSGQVYAVHESGRVFHRADPDSPLQTNPNAEGSGWHTTILPASLSGVWGLDDSLVFAWGKLANGSPFLAKRERGEWTSESNPGPIMATHGISRELIFAVGERGYIARFDGDRWQRLPSPTEYALWSVAVVSEEEVYACGPRAQWLRGSILEWEAWFDHYAAPRCVAHFGGRLWLGTEVGLFTLDDDEVVLARDDLLPQTMESRDELLVVSDHGVASTADGISFPRFSLREVQDLTADQPISWTPVEEDEDIQDDMENDWDPEEDDEDEDEDEQED